MQFQPRDASAPAAIRATPGQSAEQSKAASRRSLSAPGRATSPTIRYSSLKDSEKRSADISPRLPVVLNPPSVGLEIDLRSDEELVLKSGVGAAKKSRRVKEESQEDLFLSGVLTQRDPVPAQHKSGSVSFCCVVFDIVHFDQVGS